MITREYFLGTPCSVATSFSRVTTNRYAPKSETNAKLAGIERTKREEYPIRRIMVANTSGSFYNARYIRLYKY